MNRRDRMQHVIDGLCKKGAEDQVVQSLLWALDDIDGVLTEDDHESEVILPYSSSPKPIGKRWNYS